MMRLLAIHPLVAILAAGHGLICSFAWAQQSSKLPVIPLTAGMHMIQAEVAARDSERQQGLMFREKLAPNQGMVFVFESPGKVCMWMKNTLIPLSVAFLDQAGRIINIEDMKPHSLASHCSAEPARYALEMNEGWFQQKHIKAGTKIGGLPQ
jgi:uncharacterized membrane protein (UPF0127 family)